MKCKRTVDWLYCHEENYPWKSGIKVDADTVFRDENGIVRLILETDGTLTVMRGYTWNGCSPKGCILDLLIGTPDGAVYEPTGKPKTYYASMVHDALYQFLDEDGPFTREEADACFLQLMEESEFMLAGLYGFAARLFGRLVWRGKRKARQWRGEGVPAASFRPGQTAGP